MAYVLQTFESASGFIAYLTDSARRGLCQDGWYTNKVFGTANDHLRASKDNPGFWSIVEQNLSVESTQESHVANRPVLAMFSNNNEMYVLGAFQPIGDFPSKNINDALTPLLVHLHSTLSAPSEIRSLFGPTSLLEPFRERWKSIYAPRLPSLIPLENPLLIVRPARVWSTALTSTNVHPQTHTLREGLAVRGFTAADLDDEEIYEQTFECIYTFLMFGKDDPSGRVRSATTNLLQNAARGANLGSDPSAYHLLWICVEETGSAGTSSKNDGELDIGLGVADGKKGVMALKPKRKVLGYTFLGRITHKTIAIRHVFTHPDARGLGVAAALVIAVCRLWLKHSTEPWSSDEVKVPTLTAAPDFELEAAPSAEMQDTTGPRTPTPTSSVLAADQEVDVSIGGAGSSPSKIDQQQLLATSEEAEQKDFVCLFVSPGNPQAERLYQRCGFEILDEYWCEVGWEGVVQGEFS